jgi:hypothetical protein
MLEVNSYAWITGWGRRQRISIGPKFKQLPADEQAAVIAHEDGHIRMGHRWQRIVWLFRAEWLNVAEWRRKVWQQEYDADAWAVGAGCGDGLLRLIRRRVGVDAGMWHPPAILRMNRIQQFMSQRKAMIEIFERAKNVNRAADSARSG